MASINDLTLARKLTDRVAEACIGLESGNAPILDQVSPTTGELLKVIIEATIHEPNNQCDDVGQEFSLEIGKEKKK